MNALPDPREKRRWRPSPALSLSAGLHAAVLAGVVAAPAWWPTAVGLVAGNHVVLAGASLWPRSNLLGPNLTRLGPAACARKEVAITIDDGPDPQVTSRVLDILDSAGARASFFCIGERVERHPTLAREILARGHAIENHTYHHYNRFGAMGPSTMFREIDRAQKVISDVTGRAPRYFRAVAGLRNPFLDPILHRLELQLATWTRRGFDTVSRDPHRVLARLSRELAAGDILDMHDGNAARGPGGEPVIIDVLPDLLATMHSLGLTAVALT